MKIDIDRLCVLLRPLKRAGQTQVLASTLQLHAGTLARSGLRFCSDERLEEIARVAISLQGLTMSKIMPYLAGSADEPDELRELHDKRACTAPGCAVFGPEVDPIQRRCPLHLRSAGIQAWIAEVEKHIGKAPRALREAWAQAKEGPLTGAQMARLMEISVEEWRAAWEAAGLPPRPIQGRPRKHGGGVVDIRSYVPPFPRTFTRHRQARRGAVAPEQGSFELRAA
jgi:hypothetical protein